MATHKAVVHVTREPNQGFAHLHVMLANRERTHIIRLRINQPSELLRAVDRIQDTECRTHLIDADVVSPG